LSRNFNDGPENFADRIRSLQQNVTFADFQRNRWLFYGQMFDLRCNGTVKRIGLVLWAVLLLCFGVSACASALSNGSLALALATCVLLGLPTLGASLAALWTAFFLRPRTRSSHLRRPL
jgi:hypothetical protein